MRQKLPKRATWVDLGRGKFAFVKFNVVDTQFWIPREVAELKGKRLKAKIIAVEEMKVYEDLLELYACTEKGCKTRLSKIFMGKKLIVGVI